MLTTRLRYFDKLFGLGFSMQTIRNLNIMILAFLLILTGCFGLADESVSGDAEGQNPDNTATDVNNPPFIGDSSELLNNFLVTQNNTNITYDVNTGEEVVNGFSYNLYHSVVDIDGDSLTCGWDIDLDGTIDYQVNGNTGFTNVYVPINHFTTLNFQGESMDFATVAFIAIDEHGLGSAELIDLLGENFDDYDDSDGGLQIYTFSGADAPGSDGAVIMTMTSGADLGWASITIKASVNGAASITVPECDSTTTENCYTTSDPGEPVHWNVGEDVTVDTSCTGECTVTINVLNNREGTTLDTIIIDVE